LADLADHINGGAIIRVNDWGVQDLSLFRTPTERDVAWAGQEEDYQEWSDEVNDEAVNDAIYAWADTFSVDADVLRQILADEMISAEPPDEWSHSEIQKAIDDYIDKTADREAPGQYKDLTRQRVIGDADVQDVENMLNNWMRRDELSIDPSTWGTQVRELWKEYEQGVFA
jgi:hypothetical protein